MGQTASARGPGEPGGPDVVHQEVRLNFDNDNGSPVADFIPQVRDFDSGATANENDLTMLYLADANPPPPPVSIGTMTQYRVDVSYAGHGRVKIWNRMTKDAAIPLGTWTTAHMETDPTGTLTLMPPLFMEGTVASRRLNDITIDVKFEAVVNGQLRVVTCKPILVSVTPILVDMYPSIAERPEMRKWNFEPTTNAFEAVQIKAHLTLDAYYYEALHRPGHRLNYGFVQFLTRYENLLSGGRAVELLGEQDKGFVINDQQTGPNTALPFLDGLDTTVPFYDDPFGNRPLMPDGTIRSQMTDTPGIDQVPWVQEVNFAFYFRTHFVVMSREADRAPVLIPYGYVDWDVYFHFLDWTAETGMRTNSSAIQVAGLVRSQEIARCAPSFALEAVRLKPI